MTHIEAMKQALEALEYASKDDFWRYQDKAITSLRQAIAMAEQEPVARAWDEGYRFGVNDERMSEANIGIAGLDMKIEPARNNPYRTTPPQHTEQKPVIDKSAAIRIATALGWEPKREWVGLIHDEVPEKYKSDSIFIEGWLWAESKLKEKNQ